ncbi:MAG: 7-carboxy-7-deazaguanine synthase QueE [Fimbriimonadaceae bacterium]|nr:7-carboxy-7-deazaguanine synthase QueE [Fimbriimonadaceae bacterium]QYK55782.1 MAG: 7-carboxy-7-deazaguanine synthase QueE [Fimbriimonadaceae bacterium]
MNLRIAEVFESIQGEGMWLGTPSTFVRVSGCNLRCRWCDTPYASWEPEGPVRDVRELADEIIVRAPTHVVLTGGEPMLFPPLETLANLLAQAGKTLTVETAGTVYRELPCDLMSISPKLANSTPEGGWRERHEETRAKALEGTLQKLVGSYSYQLKFVVDPEGSPGDVAEIEAVLARLPGVRADRVFLMAEGRDAETLHRRERLLVPLVMGRGWRLAPRYHIDLFGDSRGT